MYPNNPQNGNVKNHVNTIFLAIFQLTFDNLLDAPTTITAQFFVWFELTGIPIRDDANKQIELAISADVPWYLSIFVTLVPIVLITLFPPINVPKDIMIDV